MAQKYILFIALIALSACNSQGTDAKTDHKTDTALQAAETAKAVAALKSLHYDYAKDPACGMPLKAGLEDTTLYQGKLYGFCSKECKEEFLKNPASYLAGIKN